MMNQIICPNNFTKNTIDEIIEEIDNLSVECWFILKIDQVKSLMKDIDMTYNTCDAKIISHSLLFVIYNIIRNEDFTYPYDYNQFGGIPRGGFEFVDKGRTGKDNGLGIYHSHISDIDKGVLIWYTVWSDYGVELKFEYVAPHPTDYYKSLLYRIYNYPDAYHIDRCEYLKDVEFRISESKLMRFMDFLWINK